ncbi:MAG: cytochrome P450 [Candidatus Azotimanducaceae bacterium]|jgi:cytochrome P450
MTETKSKTGPVEGWAEIDFNTEPFLSDFKKVYQGMHESGCPFGHSSSGDHYAVASHAEIVNILKQYDVWKSKYGPALDYLDSPGVLVSVDPPEHTNEVRIVADCFSKDVFNALIPDMESFVNERLDEVFEKGEMDLHDAISVPFPLFVIHKLLGFPLQEPNGTSRIGFIRDGIITGVGMMIEPRGSRQENIANLPANDPGLAGIARTAQMYVDHLTECKAKLASGEWQNDTNIVCQFLTRPGPDGVLLTDEKILGFMNFLETAGSATTTIMLSNVIYRLLTEDGAYERVCSDPELIPVAIEETLRLDAPVQGLFRTNDKPLELSGCSLEEDTKVMLLWAGANVDPEVFDDPMTFSLDRDLSKIRRHLAFGYGTHFCRGAPLARLEGEIFLKALLPRLKNLRLNGDVVVEKRIPVLQGLRHLPVAWDV